MRRFSFRLQRVLDIREQFRDELRQELVRKNHERDDELQVLARLEQESLQIKIEEGGTYSASELVMFGAYSVRLKQLMEQQQQRVAAAIKQVEEVKERYIEASKEAKALEMLRQKRREEYTEQQLKEDGRQLDELAIQRIGQGIGSRD
ncbi:MAG: flagellar export protein FliJ [bacterium]|jgi:flagellar protein FliJ